MRLHQAKRLLKCKVNCYQREGTAYSVEDNICKLHTREGKDLQRTAEIQQQQNKQTGYETSKAPELILFQR